MRLLRFRLGEEFSHRDHRGHRGKERTLIRATITNSSTGNDHFPNMSASASITVPLFFSVTSVSLWLIHWLSVEEEEDEADYEGDGEGQAEDDAGGLVDQSFFAAAAAL